MESVPCALCEGQDSDLLFIKWNHNIVRCGSCGLVYVNPRGFRQEGDDYFQGPYLAAIEERGILRSDIEYIYSTTERNLATYLVPGRLLDVGCGMGHFMEYARERGWQVHGIECSRYAAEYGRVRWGLRIQAVCDVSEAGLPGNHFDACVLIEVIEHLSKPKDTLRTVFSLLKPGGMVYLTTPNFASYRSLLERENWHAVIPTGHLYYFTANTLSRMLRDVGFARVVELTQPAKFEDDVEAAMLAGSLHLSRMELEQLRQQLTAEDAAILVNRRSQSLILCAIKPRCGLDRLTPALRHLGPLPNLEGMLVTSAGGRGTMEKRVFLIRDGLKHWIVSVDWLLSRGMGLEQTIEVDQQILDSILTGPPLG